MQALLLLVERKVLSIGYSFLFLVSSIIYDFATHKANITKMDFGSIAWVVFYMVLLSGIINKSWYGVNLSQLAKSRNSKASF